MNTGYSKQVETLMRVHYARLYEREKRRYAAMEAAKSGYGGPTWNHR